jgi:hypothetical protein
MVAAFLSLSQTPSHNFSGLGYRFSGHRTPAVFFPDALIDFEKFDHILGGWIFQLRGKVREYFI